MAAPRMAFPKSPLKSLPSPALSVPSGAVPGNVICQAYNYGTLAITGTMQNGSNSGESENPQSSLGKENKAIFFHLPSTQPSGLNYEASVGQALKGLLYSNAPNQLCTDELHKGKPA